MNKMTAWMKGLFLLTLMVGGQAGAELETVTYLHTDHLGSPIMGRDASGNTVFREEYGPWGRQLNAATPSDDVTYTGHANEGDIGLTYMKARWYDPVVGRFLSPDPVTFDGGGAGHVNRYSYVSNNPYTAFDPTGEAEISRSKNGYYLAMQTRTEQAQSFGEKIFKQKLPMLMKKAMRGIGAGEFAGQTLTTGDPVGPLQNASQGDVLAVDAILSDHIADNTDTAPSQPYSAEQLFRAYNSASAKNKGFSQKFRDTHGRLSNMLKNADANYDESFGGQNDRSLEKLINPGHGADDI